MRSITRSSSDAGSPAIVATHLHSLINVPRTAFRQLYMRSLDRLLNGLRTGAANER
jgi:hypothetical protein